MNVYINSTHNNTNNIDVVETSKLRTVANLFLCHNQYYLAWVSITHYATLYWANSDMWLMYIFISIQLFDNTLIHTTAYTYNHRCKKSFASNQNSVS